MKSGPDNTSPKNNDEKLGRRSPIYTGELNAVQEEAVAKVTKKKTSKKKASKKANKEEVLADEYGTKGHDAEVGNI
mgnify:CR=1 FL=1